MNLLEFQTVTIYVIATAALVGIIIGAVVFLFGRK